MTGILNYLPKHVEYMCWSILMDYSTSINNTLLCLQFLGLPPIQCYLANYSNHMKWDFSQNIIVFMWISWCSLSNHQHFTVIWLPGEMNLMVMRNIYFHNGNLKLQVSDGRKLMRSNILSKREEMLPMAIYGRRLIPYLTDTIWSYVYISELGYLWLRQWFGGF